MKNKFISMVLVIISFVYLYNITMATLDMPSGDNGIGPVVTVDAGNTQEAVKDLIIGHVLDFIYYIIGAIALAMIIFNGYKYVTSTLNEGEQKKATKNIIFAVVGLIIIIMASAIVEVFAPDVESPISDVDGSLATNLVVDVFKPLFDFAKYLVGGIAVAMIIYTGYQYVTSAANEVDHKKSIKNIIYTIIGLLIIIVAEYIVGAFTGGDNTYEDKIATVGDLSDGAVTDDVIDNVIYPILSFLEYIVGALAIAMTIYTGILIVIERDNEKAKGKWKVIIWSIVGLVIIIMADEIINIFWDQTSGLGDSSDLNQNAQDLSKNVIKVVVDAIKLLIGAIAIAMIIIRSLILVTTAKEEERKKSIMQIVNAIIAFIIIIVSEEFVKIFYSDGAYGGNVYDSVNDIKITDFNLQVIAIINAIERMIAVIAIAIIVWLGGKLVITPSEEQRKKSISGIVSAVIGLVLVIVSSTIVAAFYGKVNADGTSDAVKPQMDLAVNEIVGIVNYALGFLGIVAVIMIVYGGVLFMTSGANEGNKKKAISIIIGFIIGMIIIISSYAIVRTFVGQ